MFPIYLAMYWSMSLLWVSVIVLLPGPSIQMCMDGTAKQCAKAEFVPGSNLAGEGFDVTKMQRKGAFVINMSKWHRKDQTCHLCQNPYMEGKMQKLPLSVVDWRPSHQCKMKVSSSLYQSSEALLSASSSSIDNDWKMSLGISTMRGEGSLILGGSESKLAEYSMEKTKRDKFSFTSHTASCGYYSYRVSSQPLLHTEFKHAVKNLPKEYSTKYKPRYYRLIQNFGTHYITKVTLGGMVKSVTSIRQCRAALQGLSTDEVKACLDVEASASVMGATTVNTEFKHCKEAKGKTESKNSFSASFNDRYTEIFGGHTTEPELLFSADKDPTAYKEWLASLPLKPEVISYSLEPLHELLPTNTPGRACLRKAIHDFILEKSLWRNCSTPCKNGIRGKEPCICSCHNNPGINIDCCPSLRGVAKATITVVRGSGLWGDHTSQTDGYVRLNNNKQEITRTPVINNNNNPHWNYKFSLGDIILKTFDNLRLDVWDRDNNWDDDLLGSCLLALKQGVKEDFCKLNHGLLFYKVEVTCGPGLAGPSCTEYVGFPMDSQLEKAYVSRHARPTPTHMLREMGVLVDEQPRHFNQSTEHEWKHIYL